MSSTRATGKLLHGVGDIANVGGLGLHPLVLIETFRLGDEVGPVGRDRRDVADIDFRRRLRVGP